MLQSKAGAQVKTAPNNACTRLGVGPAFFGMFLALEDSRFEGESPLPPQAGNANRWAVPCISTSGNIERNTLSWH
jgi:hypothetical protein